MPFGKFHQQKKQAPKKSACLEKALRSVRVKVRVVVRLGKCCVYCNHIRIIIYLRQVVNSLTAFVES